MQSTSKSMALILQMPKIYLNIPCWLWKTPDMVMVRNVGSGLDGFKSLLGVVIYVERCDDVIRIISARKATKVERKYYEQSIEN